MLKAESVVRESSDKRDSEWTSATLLVDIFGKNYENVFLMLATTVRKLLCMQPVLAVATAPCRIFGDLHGQLRDLLLLFLAFGSPSSDSTTTYVFNGDFVDRGKHQLEVVGLLFTLKVLFPERVWLVRGNHEDRSMNDRYGFKDECSRQLGSDDGKMLYDLFQDVFNRLPLACLVAERILVVHGGIGDGKWLLNRLRTVRRPLTPEKIFAPENNWLFNILWSDPIEDNDTKQGVFGVHESPRGGVATEFAWNITKNFCARNGLSLVVRSHQSKKRSRGFDVMHENMLVRVFSARDYEGHGNDGAVLLVSASAEDGLLKVRPQVLRSVTKARQENRRRREQNAEVPPKDKRLEKGA